MAWRPDAGASPNREPVWVSEDVWREFWTRWRAIDPLVWHGAHPADVDYQREELRAWAKARMSEYGMSGPFLLAGPRAA